MNHYEMAHQIVAELLRASPNRPKRGRRPWARHQMVEAARPELERDYGKKNLEQRQDRARERAAEWLNEHGDDPVPEGWEKPPGIW